MYADDVGYFAKRDDRFYNVVCKRPGPRGMGGLRGLGYQCSEVYMVHTDHETRTKDSIHLGTVIHVQGQVGGEYWTAIFRPVGWEGGPAPLPGSPPGRSLLSTCSTSAAGGTGIPRTWDGT